MKHVYIDTHQYIYISMYQCTHVLYQYISIHLGSFMLMLNGRNIEMTANSADKHIHAFTHWKCSWDDFGTKTSGMSLECSSWTCLSVPPGPIRKVSVELRVDPAHQRAGVGQVQVPGNPDSNRLAQEIALEIFEALLESKWSIILILVISEFLKWCPSTIAFSDLNMHWKCRT